MHEYLEKKANIPEKKMALSFCVHDINQKLHAT